METIRLETERLVLRPWRLEDADEMFLYSSDPEIGPITGWKPHESVEDSRKILAEWTAEGFEDTIWAVTDRESGKVIGSLGLHKDESRPRVPDCLMIGYDLAREYWGRGLMPEAVNAVIDYAFREGKIKLMTVYHYPHNKRSRRVIEKCGFRYEGLLRQHSLNYDGTAMDSCCYSMTAAEYWVGQAKKRGLSLVLPETLPMESLREYRAEWEGEPLKNPGCIFPEGLTEEQWLDRMIAHRTHVPEHLVPATLYYLVREDGMPVGALNLRHRLNQGLLQAGGHIGYGIRPSQRGKHYAPCMLGLGLEKAEELGIRQVLVTCLDTNLASAATIEACGGKLENKVDYEKGLRRRYWISL